MLKILIISLIFTCCISTSYSQPLHNPVEFSALNYNRTDINYLDSDGMKQGRFVFTPTTCTDTNKCKLIVYFKDDIVNSKWTIYHPDSTYEVGDFKLNMKWTKKGGFKYTYPIKVGKWYHYNLQNEMLFYISHNAFYDKKKGDTFWSNTIFSKNGGIIGYDIRKGANQTKKERYYYKNDTLISYTLLTENNGKITNIKINYFKTGIIKNETRNDHYKCYYSDGTLKESHKKKIKHKKRPGVGEKYAHYITTRLKIYTYDKNGNRIDYKMFKNGKLIKEKQYTTLAKKSCPPTGWQRFLA